MEERLEGLRSFWFQIEDIASLQLALEQVLSLNESERFMLSNLSRERYLCKYSLQAVSEKYKKITKQFIN
jgi:glycosyltransferase involved in cell wall biosynthesis